MFSFKLHTLRKDFFDLILEQHYVLRWKLLYSTLLHGLYTFFGRYVSSICTTIICHSAFSINIVVKLCLKFQLYIIRLNMFPYYPHNVVQPAFQILHTLLRFRHWNILPLARDFLRDETKMLSLRKTEYKILWSRNPLYCGRSTTYERGDYETALFAQNLDACPLFLF